MTINSLDLPLTNGRHKKNGMPYTMKAAVLFGPYDMRLVDDYEVPKARPNEVVIKVAACAICGTDPQILARGWPNHPPYGTYIFGHEYAGTVVQRGSRVTKFKIGDRVAIEPHKGCGVCDNCRDGLYTTCLNYGNATIGHRHYGFTNNGGYAQYAVNHINSVYKIPDSMSFDTATLITTAGTALYGIRRMGGFEGGETVVVSGPGAVGLVSVALARVMGAGKIIITGTRKERLDIGLALGADIAINVRKEDVIERVKDLTDGHGADVVLECSGAPQAATAAVEYTKMSGRLSIIGVQDDALVSMNVNRIALGNLTITGTRAEGMRSVPRALELLSHHDIDLSTLITHTFPLDDIHRAFETAQMRLDNAIKVVVKP